MSDSRTIELKNRILNAPYEVCIERARYFTESYRKTECMHPALRNALAIEHTFKNMTVSILPEERIVGNRSSKVVGTVIPVERGDFNRVFERDMDRITKRKYRPYHISAADKKELLHDILPYWDEKTVHDKRLKSWKEAGRLIPIRLRSEHGLKRRKEFDFGKLASRFYRAAGIRPSYWRQGSQELALLTPFLITDVFDVQGHIVLGHRNVIAGGLKAIEHDAAARLEEIGESDNNTRAFLESVVICCRAAKDFTARFSVLAEQLALDADPVRSDELHAIAARCRHVPYEPPRDFHEAIQAVWLMQAMSLIAYGMGGFFAVGRLDQYLWPFYDAGIRSKRNTRDAAQELMEEFLIKTSYSLLTLPPFGRETASELGADPQAVTLGGVDRQGEDATNGLSDVMLDATAHIRCMTNSLSIRISEKTSDAFLRRAVELFRETSGPALFNDDSIIPSLVKWGYRLEDARDYAIIGCVEPTGDGDTFGVTSGNDVSLAGPLEMVLLNGGLRMLGRKVGPETGDPRQFKTFRQFISAYKKQLGFCIDFVAKGVQAKDEVYAAEYPCPFISMAIKNCVRAGKDITSGGADYNFGAITGRGFGTTVDSLAAVKELVFEENAITMDELIAALDNNFRGRESLRKMLSERGPKYGTDNQKADQIATELAEFFCRTVMSYPTPRGGILRPGFFSYGMHVSDGAMIGATPNGRKAGEPVSNSISPSNATESKGITAMLRSVSNLDSDLIPNGYSLNARLCPALLRRDEDCKKMVSLVRAYFGLRGMHISFNVVSNKDLEAAMKEPDKYKDLVVRVSGYSAYFVDLGEEVQRDIMARTEFAGF
ncbi:MAG TPA: pyruvate formate lyase family protein [Candidatus Brocadiia bacterium]|nr:pyruvate formate lyase family protein [Candidatus Brocadiia bacterium]